MPTFSEKSKERLNTCHPLLQSLLNEVIKDFDFTVLCGHREKDEQSEAYAKGMSKLRWPDSKHNKIPSLAVDVAPYPISWKERDKVRFYFLAGFILATARKMGIKIRWGGDFDGDGDFFDQNLIDTPHFEIVEE